MNAYDDDSIATEAERRAEDRRACGADATLILDRVALPAVIENCSAGGFFVTLPDPLALWVEWEGMGETHRRRAMLRRVSSLPGNRSGWGLEVVEDSDDAA